MDVRFLRPLDRTPGVPDVVELKRALTVTLPLAMRACCWVSSPTAKGPLSAIALFAIVVVDVDDNVTTTT